MDVLRVGRALDLDEVPHPAFDGREDVDPAGAPFVDEGGLVERDPRPHRPLGCRREHRPPPLLPRDLDPAGKEPLRQPPDLVPLLEPLERRRIERRNLRVRIHLVPEPLRALEARDVAGLGEGAGHLEAGRPGIRMGEAMSYPSPPSLISIALRGGRKARIASRRARTLDPRLSIRPLSIRAFTSRVTVLDPLWA